MPIKIKKRVSKKNNEEEVIAGGVDETIETSEITPRVTKLDKPFWVDPTLWESLDDQGKLDLINKNSNLHREY